MEECWGCEADYRGVWKKGAVKTLLRSDLHTYASDSVLRTSLEAKKLKDVRIMTLVHIIASLV